MHLNFLFSFLDVGTPELVLILFVALLLFGGKKLPELAKGLGKAMREFKEATSGVEAEIKRAMDEPRPDQKPLSALPPTEPTVFKQVESPAAVSELKSTTPIGSLRG